MTDLNIKFQAERKREEKRELENYLTVKYFIALVVFWLIVSGLLLFGGII